MQRATVSLATLAIMALTATTAFAEIRKVSIKTLGMD